LLHGSLTIGIMTQLLPVALVLSTIAFAAPFPQPPIPADNPQTPEKIALGKQLYFEPRISRDGTISCNSCHDVRHVSGAHPGKKVSEGVGGLLGGRNSPTVWNAAYYSVQFWDGRAPTLEEQAKGPITNPVEMAMGSHDEVVTRIEKIKEYQEQFKKVFGGDKPVTIENMVKAIAAYERTLITPDSPYDRFKAGETKALSAAAQRGMKLVETVGCLACHSGPHFAGPELPMGTGFYQKFPMFEDEKLESTYKFKEDKGRYDVTKKDSDQHMFRVQSWRNIEHTSPYFHNGSVKSLDEAVRVMAKLQLNKTLKDEEVKDIVAFLKSLTGKIPLQKAPKLPKG
jgi:cytochrome c peroxidase